MTAVRCVVHPGWIEVSGPGVHAVVAAAERHAEPLAQAAQGGFAGLLEALTAHGLAGAPDLAAVSVGDDAVRVLVRGGAVVVLADGTRVGAEGRAPWRDVDIALDAAGDEVSVEAPAPENPRGWRRPARLGRPVAVAPVQAQPVTEEQPEPEPAPDPTPPADEAVEQDQVELDDVREAAEPEEQADPVDEHDVADAAGDQTPEDGALENGAPEDEDHTADEVRVQPDLTLPPPDEASAGLPPASRVPVTAPPKGGLIDSVPWRRGAGGQGGPAPTNPPTAELPVLVPPPPAEDAPPPPPVDPEPAEQPVQEPAQAEAGHTVHDLPETERHDVVDEHAAPDVTTDRGALHRSDDDLDRPVVLAVLCPAGHPSPPHAGTCRSCGREIPPQQPFQTPRPALGVLRISTGGVVPLDRGVLLGRAPRVNEELPANQRPHLLRVGGVDRDISRNHAEVVLEGWHVLVRDLGSTNGTTVTLPGQEPVRLRPTEDQGIEPGAVITLADEVSLTYEVDG
ncbi:FHA domain-containing protein [Oryzobacter telluris]|uniref:FHA domain-containing protein n=1 Tax=Oryzobacter telluris TaxID=3149179 RepID=UPI00370DDDD0